MAGDSTPPDHDRPVTARTIASGLARNLVPAALLVAAARGRRTAAAGLVAWWAAMYARYRRAGVARTAQELNLLRTAGPEAYERHYNERVPTIEEEFALWGPFHQHRHEMRYDLVAGEVRRHLPPGGTVLDLGCGSALVADRLSDLDARYVGLDFPAHHIAYARERLGAGTGSLRTSFVRATAEGLPLADESVDVVAFSEVIEHLLRPELAVWEIARVLKPGGALVLTTNNASEVPLRSPLANPGAWLEKAIGFRVPGVVSLRPWVWPEPVDPELLPPGAGPVYLPHTHHLQPETRRMLATAGLHTATASTFEFPPPQAATSQWLSARGPAGRRAVDVVEAVARRLPLVRDLGCHLLLVATKEGRPVAIEPPPGTWPGPFSPQPTRSGGSYRR
jgi:SAM-dependent methyltransferase